MFWAYKTGKLEQVRQAVLQYVRSDKKATQEPAKPGPTKERNQQQSCRRSIRACRARCRGGHAPSRRFRCPRLG